MNNIDIKPKLLTWVRLCLIIRFLHPFVWWARWRRGLWRSRAWRSTSRTCQVPSSWRRQFTHFAFTRLSFRKMMGRLRGPLGGGSAPAAPLLIFKLLRLPSVPASRAVLSAALALVHGERVHVIHHAVQSPTPTRSPLAHHTITPIRNTHLKEIDKYTVQRSVAR